MRSKEQHREKQKEQANFSEAGGSREGGNGCVPERPRPPKIRRNSTVFSGGGLVEVGGLAEVHGTRLPKTVKTNTVFGGGASVDEKRYWMRSKDPDNQNPWGTARFSEARGSVEEGMAADLRNPDREKPSKMPDVRRLGHRLRSREWLSSLEIQTTDNKKEEQCFWRRGIG